jgi:UDP-N-acetylglucosamine transferase subunit ALG13
MKRILIAPLDWGLGHATRCIPIIRYLLEKGVEVVIGADGRPLALLKKEFPSCEFVQISGYDISYPTNGSMVFKVAVQIPKILAGIKREHELLKKIIEEKRIDAVISDNRFGLWTNEIPCVFITHQVMIKAPFGEKWMHQLNKKYISKYTECWIPDTKDGGLSGDLAHKFPLPKNAKFIGVISRFGNRPFDLAQGDKGCREVLVILSGPEPQRTVLEKKILRQIENIPSPDHSVRTPPLKGELTVLIVQGITEKNERRNISGTVEIVSHLTSEELQKEIISSEIVLSRPGYSTIMDLAVLGKKAIFIPTPGQTEQEYLAKYFMKNGIAYSDTQKGFDLDKALMESKKYSGFTKKYFGDEFKKVVDEFVTSLRIPMP